MKFSVRGCLLCVSIFSTWESIQDRELCGLLFLCSMASCLFFVLLTSKEWIKRGWWFSEHTGILFEKISFDSGITVWLHFIKQRIKKIHFSWCTQNFGPQSNLTENCGKIPNIFVNKFSKTLLKFPLTFKDFVINGCPPSRWVLDWAVV